MWKLFRPVITRPSVHNFPWFALYRAPCPSSGLNDTDHSHSNLCSAALKPSLVTWRNIEFQQKLYRSIFSNFFSWSSALVLRTQEHLGPCHNCHGSLSICNSSNFPPFLSILSHVKWSVSFVLFLHHIAPCDRISSTISLLRFCVRLAVSNWWHCVIKKACFRHPDSKMTYLPPEHGRLCLYCLHVFWKRFFFVFFFNF